MTGQKGLTIAIVALLITLCFGFLANVEETPSTRTVYNDQVNLEPLLYANSSRGSGVEFYNSIYNVTGWANANVPETSSANQYRLPSIDTYEANADISYDLYNYTHTTGAYSNSPTGWVASDNTLNPTTTYYQSPNTTYTNGTPINGGKGGITTIRINNINNTLTLQYLVNGVALSTNTDFAFKPLADFLPQENGQVEDGLKVVNDGYYFNGSVNAYNDHPLLYIYYNYVNFNGTQYPDCAYMIWDNSVTNWKLYDTNDTQIGTATNAYIVKTGTVSGTITSYSLNTSTPRFADPNKLVPIGAAETPADMAQWSNTIRDETLINARVGVLITGNLDIYPNDTDNTVIQIRNVAGNYSINIGAAVSSIGTYDGLYIVMDAQSNTLTVYGVLSFSTQAPAIQYELTPFSYSVAYTFDTDRITALYFNGQLTGQAYIANTWVYSDPAGILWNDFNLNLNDYFAERIAQHSGVRFSINGTTYYGESLTINGQVFTVAGDKIRYTATEDMHTVTYEKPLNGLNVDYVGGSVILKFSDGTQYDTGARTNYIIEGAGAWYFSSNLYNIDTVDSTEYNWVVGWSLDKNLTCVLYLGLLAVIFMLAAHYGRGEIGGFDYMVMALAGLIAFIIMA